MHKYVGTTVCIILNQLCNRYIVSSSSDAVYITDEVSLINIVMVWTIWIITLRKIDDTPCYLC